MRGRLFFLLVVFFDIDSINQSIYYITNHTDDTTPNPAPLLILLFQTEKTTIID